jgi:Mrp family chromosome partitioning ATPase
MSALDQAFIKAYAKDSTASDAQRRRTAAGVREARATRSSIGQDTDQTRVVEELYAGGAWYRIEQPLAAAGEATNHVPASHAEFPPTADRTVGHDKSSADDETQHEHGRGQTACDGNSSTTASIAAWGDAALNLSGVSSALILPPRFDSPPVERADAGIGQAWQTGTLAPGLMLRIDMVPPNSPPHPHIDVRAAHSPSIAPVSSEHPIVTTEEVPQSPQIVDPKSPPAEADVQPEKDVAQPAESADQQPLAVVDKQAAEPANTSPQIFAEISAQPLATPATVQASQSDQQHTAIAAKQSRSSVEQPKVESTEKQSTRGADRKPLGGVAEESFQLADVPPTSVASEPAESSIGAAESSEPKRSVIAPPESSRAKTSASKSSAAQDSPVSRKFHPVWEVDEFKWPAACEDLMSHAPGDFDRSGVQLLAQAGAGRKVLLITSSQRSEGRSTLALCYARWAASKGVRVALVDADFQNPQIAGQLGLRVENGWPEVVYRHLPPQEAAIASLQDQFTVMPLRAKMPDVDGTHDARVAATTEVLEELYEAYDLVLVDCEPAAAGDGLVPARGNLVSGIGALVVCDARRTTSLQLAEVIAGLRKAGIDTAGIVENFSQHPDAKKPSHSPTLSSRWR